jgi:hypothetical protein
MLTYVVRIMVLQPSASRSAQQGYYYDYTPLLVPRCTIAS